MKSKALCFLSLVIGACILFVEAAQSQQTAPDMIVFNGKIVTMDDKGFTTNVGKVAEAMAIKDGKITAVGSTAQVRAQAGPATKMIDVKGRTVLPGMMGNHEHPYDWAPTNPYIIKKVLNDDNVVTRYVKGTPKEQAEAFPGVIREMLTKAKPGQWLYVVLSLGDRYEYGLDRSFGNALQLIPEALMDQLTPNNPLLLRNVFTGTKYNMLGYEAAKKIFPQPDMFADREGKPFPPGSREMNNALRWFFHEVTMKDRYKELKEIHRLEVSWWSGYGFTSFGSQAYTPSNIRVYSELAREGRLAMRNMWGWNWRETELFGDPYVRNIAVYLEGTGNDFHWYGGSRGALGNGSNCTTATPRREGVQQGQCNYQPGTVHYQTLYNFIKDGGRFSITHTGGDKDIGYLLDIIEKASADAGMTADDIRAKRHTFDHLTLAPRPDQLDRIKRLGMVPGGAPFYFFEASPRILADYGEEAVQWSMPKKSLVDAGLPSGFEIDRPLGSTELSVFWTLARMIDRKAPQDGKVYAPNQRVPRELALKTATVWNAYYIMKENQLGSLEPGKFADFIVLDRDYFTIPETEIENLHVLMTVVGGKPVHLVPSVARENGMQPVGAQVELGGPAAQW
ncbi:MAG: hypothetical protein A3F68_02735 [Acidobacteria bacterium RIFCSPLOWO2_12_FULL_54_10]|nr:MAG: hypothetical protein A3F68_02735 [Acidobacteria bacterium RIFCSPLOWO2_12_FULL_54_10]